MSPQLHVVFGAGQVGAGLARLLRDRGHRVRVVRRSAKAVDAGIEVVAADALDPAAARDAAAGAAVIYHCMNPSAYTGEAWAREFPRQGAALIDAAIATGARLVCLDNLYAYGPTDGPRREDTPLRATGAKGRVRIAWDGALRAAAADRGLRFTAARCGDFFGPGTSEQSLLATDRLAALASGGMVALVGDRRAPHAFSYVPDVIETLAALGEADGDVDGRVFIAPVVAASPRAVVEAVAEALGVRARVVTLPGWVVRALGVFGGLLRELGETLYQWDRPFLADDAAVRARFPGLGTDLPTAARAIAACITPRERLAA